MKIVIENTTDVTKRQLSKAAGKDHLRPALTGVFVDFKSRCLVVTNGYILVAYPFEITEGAEFTKDKEGVLLPLDYFNPSRWMRPVPVKKKDRIIEPEFYLLDDRAEVWWLGEMIFTTKYIDEKYPNWSAVMPGEDNVSTEDEGVFGIEVSRMKSLMDALPKTETGVYKIARTKFGNKMIVESLASVFPRPVKALLISSSIESDEK